MPCLLALIAFFFPRIAMVLLWLFSGYLGRAYTTVVWPVIGFFVAPYTTLAYAFAMNSNGSVSGIYLVIVVIAVLLDLGHIGGGEAVRRRKRS